jgi:hypothetical protein
MDTASPQSPHHLLVLWHGQRIPVVFAVESIAGAPGRTWLQTITLGQLKAQCAELTGVPPAHMKLLSCGGRRLASSGGAARTTSSTSSPWTDWMSWLAGDEGGPSRQASTSSPRSMWSGFLAPGQTCSHTREAEAYDPSGSWVTCPVLAERPRGAARYITPLMIYT